MRTTLDTAVRIGSVAAEGAAVGVVYGALVHGHFAAGATVGATLGALLSFFEAVVVANWARDWLNRLPFSAYFALRAGVYFVVVLAVNAAAPLLAIGGQDVTIEGRDIGFALVVCAALNLLFSVNELLGPGVLFAFAAGRYRRPRREERVLLYLDLRGSTALAEALGEARFLDLLNQFYADVTASILAQGGEIHKYVGDEVIAVWRAGADPTRPIRACFSARKRLADRAQGYRARFGVAPEFRAAIHAGAVVVGELGARKKEIALIGDAMNTAARILEAARETGADVLISASYYQRMTIAPQDIAARRLAPVALRGKAEPLALVQLDPRDGGLSDAARAM